MRLILCQIGDAGLKEEAGELGLQGLLGQKGEPGMMGTDGPPGPTGEAGLIGEPGPEGGLGGNEDKGAKIQPGPSGDQGSQGECADLGCDWGGGCACGVLRPMVQVVHLPWTNRTPFTYLLKSELCVPFNYCKCTVFYNLNRSQNQKVCLTSKQFICYPF